MEDIGGGGVNQEILTAGTAERRNYQLSQHFAEGMPKTL